MDVLIGTVSGLFRADTSGTPKAVSELARGLPDVQAVCPLAS